MNLTIISRTDPHNDEMCFFILLGILLLAYSHMIYGVINELCNHLDIYCFKIVPKKVA